MLPNLDQIKHIHILGVCGTLMGAFASAMKKRGMHVTGSDQNVYPPMSDVLRDAGVEIFEGYRAENLSGFDLKPDLVVIGNVISADNPEAKEALNGSYAYCSLPQAMEELFLERTHNIVVAGTHGKTTTTSLMIHTLRSLGRDPNYFVGGVAADLPTSFQIEGNLNGGYFCLEGDEYDTAFWDKVPKFNHYLPNDVILTSIEFDHADIYANLDAIMDAFSGLLGRIREGGRLIACVDYENVRRLIQGYPGDVKTYGFSEHADYRPAQVSESDGITRFEIHHRGEKIGETQVALAGEYNVLNALAVWLEGQNLEEKPEAVAAALGAFQGVKRRQEVRGEVGDVLVIDDFAHHPTAVEQTLTSLRKTYADRKLIAVFEPRSATSRRNVFQERYAQAFRSADHVILARPYDQSRIPEAERFSTEKLLQDLRGNSVEAEAFDETHDGVLAAQKASASGKAVVAVLSNGGFGGYIPKLLEKLRD